MFNDQWESGAGRTPDLVVSSPYVLETHRASDQASFWRRVNYQGDGKTVSTDTE